MTSGKSKLHIVYLVANISDIAGGTRVIVEHVNRLHALGHVVELWVSEEGQRPYFIYNVPIRLVEHGALSTPDVVVITDPALLPVVATHRLKGKTYLLMQHDNEWVTEVTGASTGANLMSEYVEHFRSGHFTIIVVSTWLQDVVRKRYNLDSLLVPNAVDPTIFHPAVPLVTSPNPAVLVLYDPQPWKGFAEAIAAIQEVQVGILNLKLLILGKYFPETPKNTGLSYGFSFPAIYFNRPKQEELASIYASASVFLSTSWKEGFGLPGLEAMACGTPLVITSSGGVEEYVVDGQNAIVVEPQNVTSIVGGLKEVLLNKQLSNSLRKNAMKNAADFRWETSIKKLEDSFRSKVNE
jgi:glycosyltransferase involved in cell wall biosynthesis